MAVTLSKISAVAYLIIVCSATPPSPPRPLNDLTQARSSQSYVRHDVPLSYKYSTEHVYPTEKVATKNAINKVGAIQYAPLYSPGFHPTNEDFYVKAGDTNPIDVRKKHLEPVINGAQNLASPHVPLPYIPGHNIEILQSNNRSPGVHIEYRSNTETTTNTTPRSNEQINYQQIFSVFNPETLLSRANHLQEPKIFPTPGTDAPAVHYARKFRLVTNDHKDKNCNVNPTLEEQLLRNHQRLQSIHDLTKQIESQRVVGYPKMNALLLNLARVYNSHAPSNNHINYLDQASLKVPSNSQFFVKNPSIKMPTDHGNRRILSMLVPKHIVN